MNVVSQTRIAGQSSTRHTRLTFLFWVVALVGIAVLIAVPHVAAQGCAMCYQNAASSGARGRAALRHGILILLLPALSLFVGIFFLIFRRRNPA
jgi:hypothetical protein